MKLFLLVLAVGVASSASAKPIYLDCMVTGAGATAEDGKPGLLHLVLNEDEGKVGYSFGDGMPPLMQAVFKPGEVTWEDMSLSFVRRFVVSRTDLSFHSSEIGIADADWNGTCAVPKPIPKRKF